jgi:Uma2 family endonuclease
MFPRMAAPDMAAPERLAPPMTVEEYLAFEETAPVRHEYVDGYAYAMTGGSLRHNAIARNILTRLHAAARGGPCQLFMSDVKVRASGSTFYYPDVLVVCGPVDMQGNVIRNPCLVVEVLSPSTRTVDQREKVAAYRKIASVAAYLVVEPDVRVVERHHRDASGAWGLGTFAGGTDRTRVPVPCPETVLTLDDIYEGTGVD